MEQLHAQRGDAQDPPPAGGETYGGEEPREREQGRAPQQQEGITGRQAAVAQQPEAFAVEGELERSAAGLGDQGEAPPSKRMKWDLPSQPAQPPAASFSLVAFPAPGSGAPSPDPGLVGTCLSGIVESVSDSAYWVTLHLGDVSFKGALLCPPAALVDPAAAARPVAAPLKKPRTAFNFYSDAVRPAAKEKHPRADQKGISKVVGDMWAQLPAADREPYNEAARQDRERYESELRDYQARFPQGPRRDLQRSLRLPASLQEKQDAQPASGWARQHQASPMAATAAAAAAGGAAAWAAPAPPAQAVALPPRPPSVGPLPGLPSFNAGAGDTALDSARAVASTWDSPSQPSSIGASSSFLHQQQQLQQLQGRLAPALKAQHVVPLPPSHSTLLGTAPAVADGSPIAALQALLQQIQDQQQQQAPSLPLQPLYAAPQPQHAPQHRQQALQPEQAAAHPSHSHSPLSMQHLLSNALGEGARASEAGSAAVARPGSAFVAQPSAGGTSAAQPGGAAPVGTPAAALSADILSLYGRLAGLINRQQQPPAPNP